jgi:two-component system chemotaxis response regulator CheB
MHPLEDAEQERVFALAERWTGACQKGSARKSILLRNVQDRMQALGIARLDRYLRQADDDAEERRRLVSALTIHTTSWFRELPHFELLRKAAEAPGVVSPMRILVAAASTGEEAYSFALVLEAIRQGRRNFEYSIDARDIDAVSLGKARRAVYPVAQLPQIPAEYRRFLLAGSGRTEGYFTLDKAIRDRVAFATHDLRERGGGKFDWIVCRNVLIYFRGEGVQRVLENLLSELKPAGVLCLGHSEAIDAKPLGLESLGNCLYRRGASKGREPVSVATPAALKADILVVDDSASIRAAFAQALSRAGFQVVQASGAAEADACLKKQRFDLMTLDLRMPGLDGYGFLKQIRARGMKIPVIVVSGASAQEALEVLGALENGAQDFLDKNGFAEAREELVVRVAALLERTRGRKADTKQRDGKEEPAPGGGGKGPDYRPDALLIGASTGGPEALCRLLADMPRDCPPVLVVQHIAPAFAGAFAKRLAEVSGLPLGEMEDGRDLLPGHLYMAGGDYHIGVQGGRGRWKLLISGKEPSNRHRPSVDVLFLSAHDTPHFRPLAILLTGMGNDGGAGMAALHRSGIYTCAQSEDSCVVYGMPRAATEAGVVSFSGDPRALRARIEQSLARRPPA